MASSASDPHGDAGATECDGVDRVSVVVARALRPLPFATRAYAAARTAMRFWRPLTQGAAYFQSADNVDAFVALLRDLGGVYIKVGQWLAQRPDMVGPLLCDKLRELQNAAPEHSLGDTYTALAVAFGPRWRRCVQLVAPDGGDDGAVRPMASGSIAQVYRARWRGLNGDEAARDAVVKVRHPGVVERFREDFEALRTLINAGAALHSPYCTLIDFADVTREMAQQLDLSNEPRHMRELRRNFAHNPYVRVPTPYWANDAVLVESFERGIEFSAIGDAARGDTTHYADAGDELRMTRELCQQITMASFFQMMLRDGFIHGDMHGGNVLFRIERKSDDELRKERADAARLIGEHADDDASKTNAADDRVARDVYPVRVQMVLLDFGIMVRLKDAHRRDHFELLVGLYANHCPTVVHGFAQLLEHRDETHAIDNEARMAAFRCEVAALLDTLERRRKEEGGMPLCATIVEMTELLRRHGLRLDGAVARMLTGLVLVERDRPHEAQNNLGDNTFRWLFFSDSEDHYGLIPYITRILAAFRLRTSTQGIWSREAALAAGLVVDDDDGEACANSASSRTASGNPNVADSADVVSRAPPPRRRARRRPQAAPATGVAVDGSSSDD